jgi:hypothetical protein
VLLRAAERLTIPVDIGLDELLQRIISSAQSGKLEPSAYRMTWEIRSIFQRHSGVADV